MTSTSSVQNTSKVSSKPWHLTFFEKQVFIWKSGFRMKLTDGSSSGPVASTSFLNADVVNVSAKKSIAMYATYEIFKWQIQGVSKVSRSW